MLRFLSVFLVIFVVGVSDVHAAARGRVAAPASATPASASSATKPVAARAAVRNNSPKAAAPAAAPAAPATNARAATTSPKAASGAKPVGARAATSKQQVLSVGTKVSAARVNVTVNQECQNQYNGCMDAFCMLDNAAGGRCLCSDKHYELSKILAQIEEQDQKSYKMATVGVSRIEMGSKADQVIADAENAANAVAGKKAEPVAPVVSERKTIDMSSWTSYTYVEEEPDDIEPSISQSRDTKQGDALFKETSELCKAQLSGCDKDIKMLEKLYERQILADCNAFENSVKQQKVASAQKLQTAEKSLQEAALAKLESENEYDLGKCAVEFKKCMIKTGGCGEDFSKCASVVAIDHTNTATIAQDKTYDIKGPSTTISISASTYDTLAAKKPLCMNVTDKCVAVRDQVWDVFIRDVAPTLKSAELVAESNARHNCIGSISSCFQQACKDNIDPKDPDGSYDMCLSRPATMLNVCKMELNACGIDTSSPQTAENSEIWQFILARLASMRVDSCTKEVKTCLTSEDRCGEDFSQCIGLDTDSIIRLCPYEKMTGCVEKYGAQQVTSNEVYDKLSDMVQGIMLNIDNKFLEQCQKAANEAMVKVCGDTEDCTGLTVDEGVGSRSLQYKICEYKMTETGELELDYSHCRDNINQIYDEELGRVEGTKDGKLGPVTPFSGVLSGTIYWEAIDFEDNGLLTPIDKYIEHMGTMTEEQQKRITSELESIQHSINNAIKAIEADPTVQFCMTGREVQGMNETIRDAKTKQVTTNRKKIGQKGGDAARFPDLTKQMRLIIAQQALKIARSNYYTKYDELNLKMMQDFAKMGERVAQIRNENYKDVRREAARKSCIALAEASTLPKSPDPPGNPFGKILGAVVIAAACVAIPFTGGASIAGAIGVAAAAGGSTAAVAAGVAVSVGISAGIAAGAATLATVGFKGSDGSGANGKDSKTERELVGSKMLNQWNYKEVVTATFNWENLVCHRCIRAQDCTAKRNPLFGAKYCKSWGPAKETCKDINF